MTLLDFNHPHASQSALPTEASEATIAPPAIVEEPKALDVPATLTETEVVPATEAIDEVRDLAPTASRSVSTCGCVD